VSPRSEQPSPSTSPQPGATNDLHGPGRHRFTSPIISSFHRSTIPAFEHSNASILSKSMNDPSKPSRILVIDDEADLRSMLCDILEDQGYSCYSAGTARQGLDVLKDKPVDGVLLDLMLPDLDGQEALREMVSLKPDVPVVIISGRAGIADAVQAVRSGAHDFLEKPLGTDRLLIAIRNALASRRLRLERDGLIERLRENYRMVGVSRALTETCESIDRVAPTTATVLITGETGVGKELVASAIYARSARAARPFVRVNCAAIPDELIESELFGHRRGAFTGARETKKGKFHLAHEGTLFLDEVADMSHRTQAKVLRAIETGEIEMVGSTRPEEVDVRILAATNRNLDEETNAHRFRLDLYYRLNAVRIDIPPLRERKDDIVPLAEHFLAEFAERHNVVRKKLSPTGRTALTMHEWPGNVRELRNLMERLTLMTPVDTIEGTHVGEALAATAGRAAVSSAGIEDFKEAVRAYERDLLAQTMTTHDWSVPDAARALNLTTANLYKKLRSHRLKRP
jgi:two-component system nitrogen regulation response regulator NtrX